ncbi:MAG TPA: hypothetical protein VG722_13615 [Tepidisphaeraceae bacterium]|nr:hypothetical protein [Tepidisphaeraceae bacterium]
MKYATLLALGLLSLGLVASSGCSHETSHTETDKPGLFGGHVHKESTTYQNPDGTTSTEHSETKTND